MKSKIATADITVWYSGRGITDEQWDKIFKNKEEKKDEVKDDANADDAISSPDNGELAV